MIVSRKKNPPICNIKLKEITLSQVHSFKYLGTLISSDGKGKAEIKNRIGQAKSAFQKMRNILSNKSLSLYLDVRKHVLKYYIEPILLYESESWTVGKLTQRSLKATEMWFVRRMLRIPWTAKITNEECLRRIGETRKLIKNMRKRQSTFFGHVMRRGGIENILTTGKLEGTRTRGRPRETILDSLTRWHGRKSTAELIACTRDRGMWRDMVAYGNRYLMMMIQLVPK